jgi:UPF0716 protein FxsA
MNCLRDLFARLSARGPGPVALTLILWLTLEVLAFWAVIAAIGFWGAVAVGLLTSLAGVALFRQLGRQAMDGLRATAAGAAPREGAFLDGTLGAIGAALLVLPGFASDFVGLALAAPSVRGWIARTFAPRFVEKRGPTVVDLGADEWRAGAPEDARRLDVIDVEFVEVKGPRASGAQAESEPEAHRP